MDYKVVRNPVGWNHLYICNFCGAGFEAEEQVNRHLENCSEKPRGLERAIEAAKEWGLESREKLKPGGMM